MLPDILSHLSLERNLPPQDAEDIMEVRSVGGGSSRVIFVSREGESAMEVPSLGLADVHNTPPPRLPHS